MSKQHTLLNWVVDIIDQKNTPITELLRAQSLISELRGSLVKIAHYSSSPIPEELDAVLNDFTHAATYIKATNELPVDMALGPHMVPCQMTQSFGRVTPLKVEEYIAEHADQRKQLADNIKTLTGMTTVDILQKGSLIHEEKKPAPGEVEAFVAAREAHPETDDERYSSVEEVMELFAIDPVDSHMVDKKRIEVKTYSLPVTIDKVVTLTPIEHEKSTRLNFVGVDQETSELVIGIADEKGEVFRVDQSALLSFVGDLDILNNDDFDLLIQNIRNEAKSKKRDKPKKYTFNVYPLGEKYALINLDIDGSYSTFIAEKSVIDSAATKA